MDFRPKSTTMPFFISSDRSFFLVYLEWNSYGSPYSALGISRTVFPYTMSVVSKNVSRELAYVMCVEVKVHA